MQPKKMIQNASFPQKGWGRLKIASMNKRHTALSLWGLSHLDGEYTDAADIGCGGGVNVKRLSGICTGKVYGVDPSPLSVKQSKKKCARLLRANRAEIIYGSADSLPFADNSLSLITAFETVYFWSDIKADFTEVFRVLGAGGTFLITNELTATEAAPDKYGWIDDIMKINIFTAEELVGALKYAGFKDVRPFRQNDWTAIVAVK